MNREYYVYIMASAKNGTIYTGVTGNIQCRVQHHKDGLVKGFTQKYAVKNLVYYEITNSVEAAIAREKQLKNWKRDWKLELVECFNPNWRDLSAEFL